MDSIIGGLLRGNTMLPRENTPKLKDLGIEKNQAHHVPSTPTLKDLGIHKMQSVRWQQIAESHGEE